MQPAREQFLADPGFAQQQHGQFGVRNHYQLAQQIADNRALPEDLVVAGHQGVLQHIAARQAQPAILMLQPGDSHRCLDQQGVALQITPDLVVEGTGMQRIEGQRAPERTFDIQADAHAIMHGQWLADMLVEQPIVGVGQAAVGFEPGGLPLRQDGRQPWMLSHDEAPPQGFLHQPHRRQWS